MLQKRLPPKCREENLLYYLLVPVWKELSTNKNFVQFLLFILFANTVNKSVFEISYDEPQKIMLPSPFT